MSIPMKEYVYKGVHDLNFVNNNMGIELKFKTYIYRQDADHIKILLLNLEDDDDSYTSILDRSRYNILKATQELATGFEELSDQLIKLLNDNAIILKFTVDECLTLSFHKFFQIRELTLLSIPFSLTSDADKISYFKNKTNKKAQYIKNLEAKKMQLEIEFSELTKKQMQDLQALRESLNNSKEVLELKENLNTVSVERDRLIGMLEEQQTANKALVNELELVQNQMKADDNIVDKMRKQKDLLEKNYIDVMERNKVLKNALANVDNKFVSKDKYNKLLNVFVKGLASIIQCQKQAEESMSKSKMLKAENMKLKGQLAVSMEVKEYLEKCIEEEKQDELETNRIEIDNIMKKIEEKMKQINM